MANYHDIFQKGQDDIVPLAMQAMKLKMDQEQFEMVKSQALKKIETENALKERMSKIFAPKTEEVTLPEVQAPVVPSNFGGNVPQFGLPEMKVPRTVQPQPAPMEVLMATADLMKPEDFLKSYTEIKGKPTVHSLAPGNILVDSAGNKVGENTNAKPLPEINVANELDTILGGMFPGYYKDPKVREEALNYYTQHPKEIQDKVAEFAKAKAPPQFTVAQTTNGLVPFQTKGKGAGNFQPVPDSPQMYKPLTEAAAKEFGAVSTLKDYVKTAKSLYNKNYVGPVAGRYYGLAENIYNLPDSQVKFNSYVNDMKDALLRARSGAQINEQEYQRLVKFLPTVELPPENFSSRLQRFEDALDTMITEKAKVYGAQGYDVSKFLAPNSQMPEVNVQFKKPASKGAKLTDKATIAAYLKVANGDTAVASDLAKKDGWSVE